MTDPLEAAISRAVAEVRFLRCAIACPGQATPVEVASWIVALAQKEAVLFQWDIVVR